MQSQEHGTPLYRDWRGLAARWGTIAIVVGGFGFVGYSLLAEAWESDRLFAVGAIMAFVAFGAWLVRGVLRDFTPLTVYPTGIDVPSDWVFARDWDPPDTRKKSSGFHPFADIAWYLADKSRPWMGTKIGLRIGGLVVIPNGRPGGRDAFLTALAAFVPQSARDPDVASVIRKFDARKEAYDDVWHWNPREPLPVFWVGLGFLGAVVVWLPFVILQLWSLLPAFVAVSAGFALWFGLGTRYIVRREVRCLSLVNPGSDRIWAFLEGSFIGMGIRAQVTEDRPSGRFARRFYAAGALTVRVDKLWGEGDPWVQWRVVVEGPEDAVRSARGAIARAALEEGLLPTTNFYVQLALEEPSER